MVCQFLTEQCTGGNIQHKLMPLLRQSLYGRLAGYPDNKSADRLARDHCRWLQQRGPGTLLRALKRMQPKTDQQWQAVARECHYFTGNRHRMQYARYRAAGLMIGSGPVEAGCKTLGGARLKRSGMRWSSAGVDVVLAVRSTLLSGETLHIQNMAKAS